MDSFKLKLIACGTMVIDHVGFIFFPNQIIFRIIGRIAFPIFAFLIAEGYIKTSDRRKYITRLSVFGVISQVPFMFFELLAGRQEFILNIFFTLALGLLALFFLTKPKNILIKVLGVVGIALVAHFGHFSYGAYGILAVVTSYIFLQNKKAGTVSLSILPFIENVRLALIGVNFPQLFAVLSLIPIYFYNGLPGKKISRWWFYWFYPGHLALLATIFVIIK